MIPAILFCGVLALLAGSGCSGDTAAGGDIKLDKPSVEIKQGESADVKVTGSKAKSAEVDPKDSKVTATTAADKVTVKADADAKVGDATVKVTGEKGTASLKVTVKAK